MATRLTSNQKIMGSTPIVSAFFFILLFTNIWSLKESSYIQILKLLQFKFCFFVCFGKWVKLSYNYSHNN